MPLVRAKCTNCGANLEVDRAKDAAICPYCGSAYVVNDAISHYNTINNIVNHIHTENAYIYGVQESDFDVKAGELKSYKGTSRTIVIPPNVAIIGQGAFNDLKGLKEVVITENVKTIGRSAFAGCSSLERVTLIDGIEKIGESAFSGCKSLKEIELPPSVIRIEDLAFSGCSSLERVTLSDGIEFLGSCVFIDCANLKEIELPGSVKEFGNAFRVGRGRVGDAFRYCTGLEKVVLNEGITNISRNAFIGCKNLIEFASRTALR